VALFDQLIEKPTLFLELHKNSTKIAKKTLPKLQKIEEKKAL
jgi:hypothetical protein